MEWEMFIMDGLKLILWFLVAFISIIVWSRTRNAAWLLIIFGTITQFAGIVLEVLEAFGIVDYYALVVRNLSIMKLLAVGLPPLFISLGFLVFLFQKRGR